MLIDVNVDNILEAKKSAKLLDDILGEKEYLYMVNFNEAPDIGLSIGKVTKGEKNIKEDNDEFLREFFINSFIEAMQIKGNYESRTLKGRAKTMWNKIKGVFK